jgi:hypothetical protein
VSAAATSSAADAPHGAVPGAAPGAALPPRESSSAAASAGSTRWRAPEWAKPALLHQPKLELREPGRTAGFKSMAVGKCVSLTLPFFPTCHTPFSLCIYR